MRTVGAVAVAALLSLPATAAASTQSIRMFDGLVPTVDPVDLWHVQVRIEGGLTPGLVSEYLERFGPKPPVRLPAEPRPRRVGAPESIEVWRSTVAAYFRPEDVDLALRIIWCESRGDQYAANPTSSARGLWQHLGRFWEGRSAAVGLAGADIFDVHAQMTVAAYLAYGSGGWGHWDASRGCWS